MDQAGLSRVPKVWLQPSDNPMITIKSCTWSDTSLHEQAWATLEWLTDMNGMPLPCMYPCAAQVAVWRVERAVNLHRVQSASWQALCGPCAAQVRDAVQRGGADDDARPPSHALANAAHIVETLHPVNSGKTWDCLVAAGLLRHPGIRVGLAQSLPTASAGTARCQTPQPTR